MAQITTVSGISDLLAPPNVPPITREPSTGHLYAIVRTGTNTLGLYRSTNQGTNWSQMHTFTHTGLQEWGSLVMDDWGHGHLMYRIGTSGGGGVDEIWYRYVDMSGEQFGGSVRASASDANGGTIGSRWQGIDCTTYIGGGSHQVHVVWAGGFHNGSGQYGTVVGAVLVNSSHTPIHNTQKVISGNRFFLEGTPSGRRGPSIEIEHNGDGISEIYTPNLWVTSGRNKLYLIKMAWNGNGWTGPASAVTIKSGLANHDYMPGRWDGQRFLMTAIDPLDATIVNVYQRNQGNTSTALITTPGHSQGVVRQHAVSYDNSTKDVRVYAVGTSNDTLYSVAYDRSADTWGSWTQVDSTAILSSGAEWGVRRGGTYGNSRYDIVTAHSGTPNTIVSRQQSITTPPAVSSFVTSGKPYVNGGPANVSATLPLEWTFSDPDAGESQGSYALSRQIGAGSLQYYTAAGGTWGGSEVQNASGTNGVTLASGWATHTDANYQYRVKVWDSAGNPAPGYSTALTIVPSALVNPTVTAPVNASTINADQVTVTWTVSEQTGIRVVLEQTSPGTFQAYDTGAMMGYTDLTYTVPYTLATGTSWQVTLYTYNNEGLQSTGQVRTFSVVYAPPPAALSSFTPSTSLGYILVTPDVLAPVGSQPSIVESALYRRPRLYTQQLANPSIAAGSTTGWQAGDGPSLAASAVQFRSGTHSLRLVPNGAGAIPRAQTTSAAAIVDAGLVLESWTASGWIRPDTANKSMHVRLVYYDAGGSELGTVSAVYASVIAAAWQYVEVTGNANAFPTAARVGMAIGLQGTPAAGDAFYVDEMGLCKTDTVTVPVRIYHEASTPVAVADSGAASGVDYEYQWQLKGSNGTTSNGPWTG